MSKSNLTPEAVEVKRAAVAWDRIENDKEVSGTAKYHAEFRFFLALKKFLAAAQGEPNAVR